MQRLRESYVPPPSSVQRAAAARQLQVIAGGKP